MKSFFARLLLVLAVLVPAAFAKADNFAFQVAGVWPSTYYTKTVVVDVVAMPSFYQYGWRSFFLNIDGFNYPITSWNAVPTSPVSLRAAFQVPNTWMGTHRLQLIVDCWAQPYWGTPVPVNRYISWPQLYAF